MSIHAWCPPHCRSRRCGDRGGDRGGRCPSHSARHGERGAWCWSHSRRCGNCCGGRCGTASGRWLGERCRGRCCCSSHCSGSRCCTRGGVPAPAQGLTLVHYSAQLEPFVTQKHTRHTPNTPYHPLNTPETTPNCTPCHTEGAEVELRSGRV
jgi:hypothetical protein